MRDHVLEDELRVQVERGRIQFLLDGILAALEAWHAEGRAHPDLQPAHVTISAWDEIGLAPIDGPVQRASDYVAPETEANGTLTPASNMYSFGRLMLRFFPKDDELRRAAAPLVVEYLQPDPAARPTASAARAKVRTLGWLTGAPPAWTPHFLAADDTERRLVAALRANSGDVATRHVYADWLDEHGQPERAQFIRSELDADQQTLRGLAEPADLRWRAAVSRAQIVGCRRPPECSGAWAAMIGDGDETRRCSTCDGRVRYCWTDTDFEQRARGLEILAIDASLQSDAIVRRYRELTATGPRIPIGNPPPPVPTNPPPPRGDRTLDLDLGEDKPGVLARFFGWIKRR
ncbi:MAG TPA: TIGR02996 domain-containing protein [Xanthomonadales bacterium]|nr:TIGR02996 domain-containing protein [Xanthomonadales bacterium]